MLDIRASSGFDRRCQSSTAETGKTECQQVIIDLRSDGGGALTEAVSLSGRFIPGVPLFRSAITTARAVKTAIPTGRCSIKARWWYWLTFQCFGFKIFAAAMQDYGCALVVGQLTFGKGTVQQYRSLNRIYDLMLRPEWPALGSVQYTIEKCIALTAAVRDVKA
ncbi:S41 family peptidase [Shigella flexneri]